MTEKRFFILQLEDDDLPCIRDRTFQLDDIYGHYKYDNLEQLCSFLNELNDENEKLKAQLYCNHDGGVCSICKHCYLDEQSLYYISKCEKGHEKCSKKDLRYCDDFEIKELQE